MNRRTKVSLVGSGPGDPDLITVKGLNTLKNADVVIYDRLAPLELLQHARPDAELIDAGKTPSLTGMDQDGINAAITKASLTGKSVCRLKGGDPFVFGRGAEEALALAEAGVPFEVIPGVTSAIAAPAASGIPVTHRGASRTCVITTGSTSDGELDPDHWRQLAQVDGTLVVLMAAGNIAQITAELMKHGRPASEPAAATRYGTRPDQETVIGTLDSIAKRAGDAGLRAPVVFTFGQAVRLAKQINWVESRPLHQLRVVVSRARSSQSRLAENLREHGATVIETPAIRIEPLNDHSSLDLALFQLHRYDWVSFASRNAVAQVFARIHAKGRDARLFAGTNIAAIGPATVQELRQHGIAADLVPADYSSSGLLDAFSSLDDTPRNVLAFKSDIGRESVMQGLSELGADVDLVSAYRTVHATESADKAKDAYHRGVDITTFTSSSTVTNLLAMLDNDHRAVNDGVVACIGPITAETARKRGVRVDIVPTTHTIDAMVGAIVERYAKD